MGAGCLQRGRGSIIDPTPYWPGASNVDMVGVDGYPQSQYGETSFANTFAESFSIIQGLSGESTQRPAYQRVLRAIERELDLAESRYPRTPVA